MYAQVYEVSMGSPLGPVFANIFVGYYERFLFEKYCKPHVYIDDTFFFSIFDSIKDAEAFHTQLNSLHPTVQFTMEGKQLHFVFFWTHWSNGKEVLSLPVFIGSLRSHVYTPYRKLLFVNLVR